MYQSWVDASRIMNGSEEDIWAVDFTAHPLLDPDFATKGSRLQYLTRRGFRRMIRDDEDYRQELIRVYHPQAADHPDGPDLDSLVARTAEYLREADIYLASTSNCSRPETGTRFCPFLWSRPVTTCAT